MDKKNQETREKFDVINRLLDDEFVVVHVDPKIEGVILPEHLLKDISVTLKLSRHFRGGIEVGPEKIQANLSFNQKLFACTLPLASIWGVASSKNQNIMWPDSTPIEYLKAILENQMKEQPKEKKGGLRRVK